MGILGSLISSIIGGGATGLLGVIIQRFADHQDKKLNLQIEREKMAHESEMRKVDAELMAQEWAQKTKVAEVEAGAMVDAADAQAFAASFKEPERFSQAVTTTKNQGWILVLLDALRGIVRPGLTVYLCAITTAIYSHAAKIAGGLTLSTDQALQLLLTIVNTILYLTTTCVLWWFGTRNRQPAPSLGK